MNKDTHEDMEEEITHHEALTTDARAHYASAQQSAYAIPAAILLAGAFVAGAIVFTQGGVQKSNDSGRLAAADKVEPSENLDAITPVTSEDHIRGNPDAPIKIVEYSDMECPFCHRFHETLQQIMEKYGDSGDVAWVYRHYPIDQLHRKARAEAVATECVAELGGNEKFWQFLDGFIAESPANDRTDLDTLLPQLLDTVGIDRDAFAECVESGDHDERIQAHVNNALATGGKGTPWSILIAPDGTKYPINGAQSFEFVDALIQRALDAR